ncbi:hypothetical protein BGW80DRAFT_1271905, partial [Lactifluus volemus]
LGMPVAVKIEMLNREIDTCTWASLETGPWIRRKLRRERFSVFPRTLVYDRKMPTFITQTRPFFSYLQSPQMRTHLYLYPVLP